MKYCPNCDPPAEDLQAFCINCGCKLPDKTGTGNSRPGGSNQTNAHNRANTGNQASGSADKI